MTNKVKSKFSDLEGAWAATGFALVLIVVGLPLWWWTTTVYRAPLPYSMIEELSELDPHHGMRISVITNSTDVYHNLNELLNDKDSLVKFEIELHFLTEKENNLFQSVKSIDSLEKKFQSERNYDVGSFTIYILPTNSSLISPSEIILSHKRFMIIHPNCNMSKVSEVLHSISLDSLARVSLQKHLEKDDSLNINKEISFLSMRQVPTEPSYDVTLTLMLPQPHFLRAEWDVRATVAAYLDPLVSQLKDVCELRVRSQVLYMASLHIQPKWSALHQHYALPEEQLPLTINAIEAKLGSFVSTRPSLHFIVYVPTEDQSPLQIHDKSGQPLLSNSFLVPRWGGVLIHNPPADRNRTVEGVETFALDEGLVMTTALVHLRDLFPIPDVSEFSDVRLLAKKGSVLLTDWQLDGLARARVLAYLHNIRITLQSLCRLVVAISNMVVSDEVGGWAHSSAAEWDSCLAAAKNGSLEEATRACGHSFQRAHDAFFHPSMLALLYFPDNQKYAIYVPLFLPVSIPVVFSLKSILKLIRSRKMKQE